MRRLLATTVLALMIAMSLGLAGCGSDTASDPSPGSDPSSQNSPSGSNSTAASPSSDGAAFDVTILSASAAGGKPNPVATDVSDPAALAAFVKQFRSSAIGEQLRGAVSQATKKGATQVYAAVVGLSCDVAPGADAVEVSGKVTVTAHEVATPTPECYVPVTSVAVASR